MSTGNAPTFKMDRVRGDLPPDPNPVGGKGRPPVYARKLQEIIEKAEAGDPGGWWLICESKNRRASQAVLGRIRRGEIEVPVGSHWEFETRQARGGKGRLYGRLLSVDEAVD